MLWINIIFLGLLTFSAWTDYHKKEIWDIVTAIMWLLCLLYIDTIYYSAVFFASFFFLNTLLKTFNQDAYAWGDVLIVPPYLAMFCLFTYPTFGLFGLLLAAFASLIKKKGVPLVPFLWINYLFFLLVSHL